MAGNIAPVIAQDSLSVCDAEGLTVSRFSQVDAPQRCLSAYRASDTALADGRVFQKRQSEGKVDGIVACSSGHLRCVGEEASGRRATRSIEALRRKRLRRNKKKREALKMMTKSERKAKYSSRAKKEVEDKLLAKSDQRHSKLKEQAKEYKLRYEKEKKKKLKTYRYKVFSCIKMFT